MALMTFNIMHAKLALRKAASTNSNRIYIIPSYDNWLVKKEGLMRSSGKFSTKKEAMEFAKQINKANGKIVVHKRDGSIEMCSN